MGSASNWLKEERRKTLGDWVTFCLECGFALRWFAENESDLPRSCSDCGGKMLSRCPACDARFSSVFAVACEACGGPLRAAEGFGSRIRKPGR